MSNKLLIASIYGPSELNPFWYSLQKRFIGKTTVEPYDYKVVLNGIDPAGFDSGDLLWVNHKNERHAPALTQLMQHFLRENYESYLILDSDCFPIRHGWQELLVAQMIKFGKQVAAPVRTENLDLFPHPCAFFMLRGALSDPRLEFTSSKTANLIGGMFQEVGARMQGITDLLLPLLRTNVVNVHPVAAAIYHHCFYHHGAGSRSDFNFRILTGFAYYDHWYDREHQDEHGELILRALKKNPVRFINMLVKNKTRLIRRMLKKD